MSGKKFFQWDVFAALSDSPLSTIGSHLTFFVPAISLVYYSLRNSRLADFVDAFESHNISLPALLSYGAALLFYVGSILTKILCPPEIERCRNFEAFHRLVVEKGLELASFSRQLGDRASDGSASPNDDRKTILSKLVQEKTEDEFFKVVATRIDHAEATWDGLLVSNPKARALIGFCFAISAITYLIVFFIYTPLFVFGAFG